MKKNKYCLALAALMLVACNQDDLFTEGPGTGGSVYPDGRREVKLTIPGVGGGSVVPYAALATADENKLDRFDVYVFGMDTLSDGSEKPNGLFRLEEIFKDLALSGVSETRQGTISLMGKNRKRLYYVANGGGIASLDSVILHQTTRDEFRKKVTDPIPVQLACPLLMTDSTVIDNFDTDITAGSIEVKLRRSMARFDVINRGADSDFFIDWIEVENARSKAYIFPNDAAPYAGPVIAKMERINFGVLQNANNGETNSAFYLYPTVTAGEASLILGGVTGTGVKAAYPVKFTKTEGGTEKNVQILPNKRYMIEVLSLGTAYINATIKVADWIIGDTIRSEAGYGTIKLSAAEGVTGFADNTLTVAAAKMDAPSVINVTCDSEWEVVTTPSWITVTPETPATGLIAKSFKIQTTEDNPSGLNQRVGVVTLRNKMRPSVTQSLIVKQAVNETASIDLISSRMADNKITLVNAADSVIMEVALGGTTAPTSYTFESSDAWLIATTATTAGELKSATAGEGFLKIKAEPNPTTAPRTATLTLIADGLKQVITVTQTSKLATMTVSTNELNFAADATDANGQEVTVTLSESGDTWSATLDSETDFTLENATSVTGNGTFTVKPTAANTSFTAKTATITITSVGGLTKTVTVTQAAAARTLTVNPATVEIIADGTTIDNETITVETNDEGNWSISIVDDGQAEPSWVTATADTGGGTIAISMVEEEKDNSLGTERTATLTVTNKTDDTVKATVTITQAGTSN